jgi:hypothetical protein
MFSGGQLKRAASLTEEAFVQLGKYRAPAGQGHEAHAFFQIAVAGQTPYKFSDDLILELVNVTATLEDPGDAVPDTCWIQIVEPHDLIKHQQEPARITLKEVCENCLRVGKCTLAKLRMIETWF